MHLVCTIKNINYEFIGLILSIFPYFVNSSLKIDEPPIIELRI